jgi:Asp-tRNA(Asn)/Glu-tRNA(Gln) amidotransferase A subunit family amidase
MAAGEQTAEAVVREHLDRLLSGQASLNGATHVLAEEALAEARSPRPGPLSGLPVSIKETFCLAGHEVTAGSRVRPPTRCADDAEAVLRLREAGAIVIARSNVPEFAMAGETDNFLFGRSANPLNPDRTCGGSSGGEGVLVASGGSALGLGSDILGSIRIPAAFCGVVGFKPTSDAVSKAGSWPSGDDRLFVDSWLAAGPLARSVRDARLAYGVLAARRVETGQLPTRILSGPGLTWRVDQPCIEAAVAAARASLERAGLEQDAAPLPDVRVLFNAVIRILGHELVPHLKAQLADSRGRGFSVTAELGRRLVGRGQIYPGLLQLLSLGPIVRAAMPGGVNRARETVLGARLRIRDVLATDGVIVAPTVGMLAPRHGMMNRQTLKPGVNLRMTALIFCNCMDLPAISVPAWRHTDTETGLVPGVMLVGAPGAEGRLLEAAELVEAAVSSPPGQSAGTSNKMGDSPK